jgi:hypothetical protein
VQRETVAKISTATSCSCSATDATRLARECLFSHAVAVAIVTAAAAILAANICEQIIHIVFIVVVGLSFASNTTFERLPPAKIGVMMMTRCDAARECSLIPVTASSFDKMTPELEVLRRYKCREALFSEFANKLFEYSANASAKSPDTDSVL